MRGSNEKGETPKRDFEGPGEMSLGGQRHALISPNKTAPDLPSWHEQSKNGETEQVEYGRFLQKKGEKKSGEELGYLRKKLAGYENVAARRMHRRRPPAYCNLLRWARPAEGRVAAGRNS